MVTIVSTDVAALARALEGHGFRARPLGPGLVGVHAPPRARRAPTRERLERLLEGWQSRHGAFSARVVSDGAL